MPISSQQDQQIRRWIEERFASAECPCGVTHWTVSNNMIAPFEFHDRATPFDGYTPIVMLVCDNCAHVELFSALAMGVSVD